MLFDNTSLEFNARTAPGQGNPPRFVNTTETFSYDLIEDKEPDGAPDPPHDTLSLEKVFSFPSLEPLNQQRWDVEYVVAGNRSAVRVTFYGAAFSEAISSSSPSPQDEALLAAFLQGKEIVLDLKMLNGNIETNYVGVLRLHLGIAQSQSQSGS